MEHVAIFGLIELTVNASAGGTLTFSTDLPGDTMAVQQTIAIPITVGRRVTRLRMPGTVKGRLYSVKVTPTGAGIIKLYAGRIWARILPSPQWEWIPIPIPPTSEEWERVALPIPPTSEQWERVSLPIPPTSEQWERVSLPIKPTPANPEWVDIPIDS
jgi:hypothetical protein